MKHETGLRHRALKGIDEEQTTIGHIEHALHLSTEIRVTRRVEDIDFHTFPVDTDVLTQNGYTALSLQIVGVEHFTAVILSIAEEFAREHHLIDQRCLAVIDMCNDCNVTNILHFTLKLSSLWKILCKGTKIIRNITDLEHFPSRKVLVWKKVVTLHPHFRKIRCIRHRCVQIDDLRGGGRM